jgi:hypothetical protein
MSTRLNYTPYLKEQLKTLDLDVAAEILNKFDPSKNEHVVAIYKPRGGQVLIYFITLDKKQDYKVDGYSWTNNGGRKPSPPSNPVIFKTYYDVTLGTKEGKKETSSEFKKVVFEIMDNVTKNFLVTSVILLVS